jgi:hypothetical protein
MASKLLLVAILLGSSSAALAVSKPVDRAVKLCQTKKAACLNYRTGRIKHFVELDEECNVLQAK